MKKLLPLLFLIGATVALSAKTNVPARAQQNKTLTSNPLGGPPAIPSLTDGLGPPPAIPIGLDPITGSLLLGLVAYGAKKIHQQNV